MTFPALLITGLPNGTTRRDRQTQKDVPARDETIPNGENEEYTTRSGTKVRGQDYVSPKDPSASQEASIWVTERGRKPKRYDLKKSMDTIRIDGEYIIVRHVERL